MSHDRAAQAASQPAVSRATAATAPGPAASARRSSARPKSRFSVPRGLIAGTLVAAALVWGPYAVIPGSSLLSALVQTGVYLGLLLLTICSRRAKVLLV